MNISYSITCMDLVYRSKEEERRRNLLSDDSQPLCGGFSYGRTFSTKSGKIAFLSLFIGGEF